MFTYLVAAVLYEYVRPKLEETEWCETLTPPLRVGPFS